MISRSHLTALLAVLASALIAATAATPPADAAWPGAEGRVVYVGLDPTPVPGWIDRPFRASGLRSFDPAVPASQTQLTTDRTDRDPKVSPDGRRVVFSRTILDEAGRTASAVFVVNADGTGLAQLTDPPAGASDVEPTFFPAGNRIAFVRVGGTGDPDGRGRIYATSLNGGARRPLTSGYAEVRTPAVSPTGRQIVFECRHFRGGIEYSWEHICSIRPDGSHRRDLTPRFRDGQPAIDPDFSPDGRLIAFSVGPGTAADVFTVRADGSRLAALTNRGPRGGRAFPRARGYDNPAFSPRGGSLIAVARSGTRPRFVRIPLADPAHPLDLDPGIVGRSPAWAPLLGKSRSRH